MIRKQKNSHILEKKTNGIVKEDISYKNPYVDKLIAECNRITKILKDDELLEKERKKHQK